MVMGALILLGKGELTRSDIEKSLGKKLPINVDGAIAALLCEMDFDPLFANAFSYPIMNAAC